MKDTDIRQFCFLITWMGKDKPCPVCGESLLTGEEEHDGCRKALRRTNRKGDRKLSRPYPTEHLDYWSHPKWHLPFY